MKRNIRLPKDRLQLLRDLRDSYEPPRPIPSLINAALRGTRNKKAEKIESTTREGSMAIKAVLDDEFQELPHGEIVARIIHALRGLEDKILHDVIRRNRENI